MTSGGGAVYASLACGSPSFEDIAILTSGTMIAEDFGIKFENVNLQVLGKARRVRGGWIDWFDWLGTRRAHAQA